MKTFEVWIPEERVEIVKVLYEVEAENETELFELIREGNFMYSAEYIETKSIHGFEVKEVFYNDAEVHEIRKIEVTA